MVSFALANIFCAENLRFRKDFSVRVEVFMIVVVDEPEMEAKEEEEEAGFAFKDIYIRQI